MGASEFMCGGEVGDIADVAAAFRKAVEQAQYDYGHAGYTGTIAEKNDYVPWVVPSEHTITEVNNLLVEANCGSKAARDTLASIFGTTEATIMSDTWGDKWGPAVALLQHGKVMFCGLASC